jgi:general L-amino acid transport system substrate-binding protein
MLKAAARFSKPAAPLPRKTRANRPMLYGRILGVVFLCLMSASAYAGARLDAIRARGHLNCGVATDTPGMSIAGPNNAYRGFEPDLCRAIAAAIFGAPRVVFQPTLTLQTFLQTGDTDLVLRGLSWSFRRETGPSGLRFGPIVLYDGQSFLVRAKSGIKDVAALSGKKICVSSDTYADFLPPLQRYFLTHHYVLAADVVQMRVDSERRFFGGQCEALTADSSELAEAVITRRAPPGEFEILHTQITKEPLAALLRKGDDQFFDIVRWAVFALINAEELGITQSNAAAQAESNDPDIIAFFAPPPAGSGFATHWTRAIIDSVGNYGEIFERHLGAQTAARLSRGPNRPWTEGGLLYAPPIR